MHRLSNAAGLAPRAASLSPLGTALVRLKAKGQKPKRERPSGRSCFDVQPLQLVDERRAAQVEQSRGLALVAAGLLEAPQDQVARPSGGDAAAEQVVEILAEGAGLLAECST
jgi:hypothetical protein